MRDVSNNSPVEAAVVQHSDGQQPSPGAHFENDPETLPNGAPRRFRQMAEHRPRGLDGEILLLIVRIDVKRGVSTIIDKINHIIVSRKASLTDLAKHAFIHLCEGRPSAAVWA